MTQGEIRLRHAEHCGWMIFSDRTILCFGREADARIASLQAQGFGIKKLYCKPGLIPDDGYVSLLGATLRHLLEIAPGDAFALDVLSRLGTNRHNGDLFLDFTEVATLSPDNDEGVRHEN